MILEGPVPAVGAGGGWEGVAVEGGVEGVCAWRAGCRLQPNFNEYRGEYPLFLVFSFSPPLSLGVSF